MEGSVYIALLRGINVGGVVLKMADLKDAVSGLGFHDLRTYLQSGNVVLRAGTSNAADVAASIAKALEAGCGIDVQVLAYSQPDWEKLLTGNPFPAAEDKPKTLHAFMLSALPEKRRLDELAAKDWGSDEWRVVGDALYMHTPDGFGKSKLAQNVERLLKVPMTARNWNTMRALAEMARQI